MTLGIFGGIASIVCDGPTGEKPSWMSMCGIDATISQGDLAKPAIAQMAFQYWPESIQDTIEVGWNFVEIPGASHALAQWGSNGGRTISFEVVLSRLMKPTGKRTMLEKLLDPFEMTKPEKYPDKNVNVAAGIRYLRAYCYPLYKQGQTHVEAYPPPIAVINAPNSDWNEQGGDTIYAVMTGCDVTRQLAFPDGTPRLASVSLTFRQVVQTPTKGLTYVGRQVGSVGTGAAQYKIGNYDGAKHGVGKPEAWGR